MCSTHQDPCLDSEQKIKAILEKTVAPDPVAGVLLHMLEDHKAVGNFHGCSFFSGPPNSTEFLRPQIETLCLTLTHNVLASLPTDAAIKNEQEVAKVEKWVNELSTKTGVPARIGDQYKPPEGEEHTQ